MGWFMDELPFKGFVPEQPPVRLERKVRVRRATDAGNRGRDMMQDNHHHNHEPSGAGINTMTAPPVYTAGQRKTMRQGPRIPARIIARAHLRR